MDMSAMRRKTQEIGTPDRRAVNLGRSKLAPSNRKSDYSSPVISSQNIPVLENAQAPTDLENAKASTPPPKNMLKVSPSSSAPSPNSIKLTPSNNASTDDFREIQRYKAMSYNRPVLSSPLKASLRLLLLVAFCSF